MLLVVIIWSVSVNLEKIALKSTSPAFLLFYENLIGVITFAGYLSLVKRQHSSERVVRRWWKHILVIASFSCLSVFLQLLAVRLTNSSYVLAVKRLDVLFVVCISGLFLNERHIKKRFGGAIVALSGVFLLYFVK